MGSRTSSSRWRESSTARSRMGRHSARARRCPRGIVPPSRSTTAPSRGVGDVARSRRVVRLACAIRRRRWRALMLGALALAGTTFAARAGAQRWRRFVAEPNAPYDGKFTFVRLSYTVYNHSGWEFDYPAMERNFMTILN